MEELLPYKCEYAKSDRSTCIGCDTFIPEDSLRIAQMVQVSVLYFFYLCHVMLWYSYCIFSYLCVRVDKTVCCVNVLL